MQRQLQIPSSAGSARYPFVLDDVLTMEQDYRWHRRVDGWLSGVLAGNLVHLRQTGDTLEYRANSNLDDLLHRYFRFDDDINAIYDAISTADARVAALIKQYPHLRFRRQPDPWECTVAYICSARNTLKRIRDSVEQIAESLGEAIELDGEPHHTFPSPEMVLSGAETLEGLGLGLRRDEKILAAARRVVNNELNFRDLADPGVPDAEARRQLMQCHGIGPKIAACIALFSLDKTEAFPVDVHVRNSVSRCLRSQQLPSKRELDAWFVRFGCHAGYVSQFLFRADLDAARAAGRSR